MAGPCRVGSLSRVPGSASGEAPKAIHAAGRARDQREPRQAWLPAQIVGSVTRAGPALAAGTHIDVGDLVPVMAVQPVA